MVTIATAVSFDVGGRCVPGPAPDVSAAPGRPVTVCAPGRRRRAGSAFADVPAGPARVRVRWWWRSSWPRLGVVPLVGSPEPALPGTGARPVVLRERIPAVAAAGARRGRRADPRPGAPGVRPPGRRARRRPARRGRPWTGPPRHGRPRAGRGGLPAYGGRRPSGAAARGRGPGRRAGLVAAAWQVAHRTGHGLADAVDRWRRRAARPGRPTAWSLASWPRRGPPPAWSPPLPLFALAMGSGCRRRPAGLPAGTPIGLACLAGGPGLGLGGLALDRGGSRVRGRLVTDRRGGRCRRRGRGLSRPGLASRARASGPPRRRLSRTADEGAIDAGSGPPLAGLGAGAFVVAVRRPGGGRRRRGRRGVALGRAETPAPAGLAGRGSAPTCRTSSGCSRPRCAAAAARRRARPGLRRAARAGGRRAGRPWPPRSRSASTPRRSWSGARGRLRRWLRSAGRWPGPRAPVSRSPTRWTGSAAELAARARADVEDRARRVGVRAAVPLGLCLLPAFLLIGIVPVVAGLVSDLGG